MYKIDKTKLVNSPRMVGFWECCLAIFYEKISTFHKEGKISVFEGQPVEKKVDEHVE